MAGDMKTVQVFVSHTSDMSLFPAGRSFVQAVLDAVSRAGMAPVDMRYFAARDGKPADYCRRRVRECEIYVAVVGFRYGSIVPGEKVSYTELEFLQAGAAGLPRLIFLLDEAAKLPQGLADASRSAVAGFRQRLCQAGLLVRWFGSNDGLELEVFHALTEVSDHGPGAAWTGGARRQLTAPGTLATAAKGVTGDDLAEDVPQAPGTGELLAAVRAEAVEERRQREAVVSALRQAVAERDRTLERARAAEADAARAAARHRLARTRLAASSVTLAVIATGLIIALVIGFGGASAAGTVVFQFPASRLLPGPPGVTVRLDLPSSSHHADWMFTIRLRLVSAVPADTCVHDSQMTYTLRHDGAVVASGRPAPGQPQITAGPLRVAGIGGAGDVLYLTVGVVVSPLVDCQFALDPSGTSAYPG